MQVAGTCFLAVLPASFHWTAAAFLLHFGFEVEFHQRFEVCPVFPSFGDGLLEMLLEESLELLAAEFDDGFYQIDDYIALSGATDTLLGRMMVRMCVRSISSNLL